MRVPRLHGVHIDPTGNKPGMDIVESGFSRRWLSVEAFT